MISFILFQSFNQLRLYTFSVFVGALVFPLQTCRPTVKVSSAAKIKAALVIFVSSEPFYQSWKQISRRGWGGGNVWAARRVGQQLPLEGVDKVYCR